MYRDPPRIRKPVAGLPGSALHILASEDDRTHHFVLRALLQRLDLWLDIMPGSARALVEIRDARYLCRARHVPATSARARMPATFNPAQGPALYLIENVSDQPVCRRLDNRLLQFADARVEMERTAQARAVSTDRNPAVPQGAQQ